MKEIETKTKKVFLCNIHSDTLQVVKRQWSMKDKARDWRWCNLHTNAQVCDYPLL